MLRFLKGFFKAKHPDVTPAPVAPVAPYKVEAPAPVATLAVDGHGDVHEVKPADKPKRAPAKKAPAKKPAAMKAPAKPKAPRKPRAPK